MIFSNFHTHSSFSDGSGEPSAYAAEALRQNLGSLGFSDHSPLPFPNTFALKEEETDTYCQIIQQLKEQYREKGLDIYLGLETDYIHGIGLPLSWFREHLPLDYQIGSVHLVSHHTPDLLWFIDGPDPATYDDGLMQLFGGDIRKGVTAYYNQINEMIAAGSLDVVGHLDKIKMHNRGRFFSEEEAWYIRLIDETLHLIKNAGVIVEVNTRGIYKKRSDTLFPGPVLLHKIKNLGIPIMLSSDAHRPEELIRLFPETTKLLSSIGFLETYILTPQGWNARPLNN